MTTIKRAAIAPHADAIGATAKGHSSQAASDWERHRDDLPTLAAAPQSDFIAELALAPALTDPLALDDLAYLDRLYDAEMQAGETAQSTDAKVAHYDLAYRCALRARNLRASMRL